MRAYSAANEESLRASGLLQDWAGEGFVTESQHQQMQQETVCELRRTNIFLRLVLFLFSLIILGAAVALFFLLFLGRASQQTIGLFLVISAAGAYAAAEQAVSRFRLYRYGIEEALLASTVGFLCTGIYFSQLSGAEVLAPIAGSIVSLWIWHRFGLPYFFFAGMICPLWLPFLWAVPAVVRHLSVIALFAVALAAVLRLRPRYHLSYLNQRFSIAEALLWFGIYVATNLQLSDLKVHGRGWFAAPSNSEFSTAFYWTTWALIWCLPPVVLARGLRLRDRFVIAVGLIVAILTLVTNKPYFGGQQHSWDPMLLGAFFIVVVLVIRRWLAQGPNETRLGFTVRRLSGKDKEWINAATTAIGLAAPQAITPGPQANNTGAQFGGGDSGGGGASSDW